MGKLAIKLGLSLLGALLLLVGAAVVALFWVDVTVFRGQLEAQATAALGRPVQFGGPITLEPSLRPRIVVEQFFIGNPDWTTNSHLAQIERVEVQIALLPLLQGELKVFNVLFAGVEVFLEVAPDGLNNFTFGESEEPAKRATLPAIRRLEIRDASLNHRSARGTVTEYQITEAKALNIPGEPERIEGQGLIREVPFTVLFTAGTPAEPASPTNPWSMELDVRGEDWSLTVDGHVVDPFAWSWVEYQIEMTGKGMGALGSLIDAELPATGPFQVSASGRFHDGLFDVTDLAAHVHGTADIPEIKISEGQASGGQTKPVHVALRGKLGGAHFSSSFESAPYSDFASTEAPWPMAAELRLADAQLNVEGEMTHTAKGKRFDLEAGLAGENVNALFAVFGVEFPGSGPYQFSMNTNIADRSYRVADLQGHVEELGAWKTVRIERAEVSADADGWFEALLDGALDSVPVNVAFTGGSKSTEAETASWPVKLVVSAAGARLDAQGSTVTGKDQAMWQATTRLEGERFERLSSLFGVSLPRMGPYELAAELEYTDNVYDISELKGQLGATDFAGSARWENTTPRPFLKGKLSLNTLALGQLLDTPSQTSPERSQPDVLDRPIETDWLEQFDADLDISLRRVIDARVSAENVTLQGTIQNGKLSAPFGANIAGTAINGRLQLSHSSQTPVVALEAKAGPVEAEEVLRRLDLPHKLTGKVTAITFEGQARGASLRSLFEAARVDLGVHPVDLRYRGNVLAERVDLTIKRAELTARSGRPVTATVGGTLQTSPFEFTVSVDTLVRLLAAHEPWPLEVLFETAETKLSAQGSVAQPLRGRGFDLNYKVQGKEIEGLSPLFDLVLPLRGAYELEGHFADHADRYRFETEIRLGKSDLNAVLTLITSGERPRLIGRMTARQLHLDDVVLAEADPDKPAPGDSRRVIPEFTLPLEALFAADLELDFNAERVRVSAGDLGNLVFRVELEDGRFRVSPLDVTGWSGARIRGEYTLDAAADPPLSSVRLTARDVDYGFLLNHLGVTDRVEGVIDLDVNLVGSGTTRYSFLENVSGHIALTGGPGTIQGRLLELWAADLVTTMLSPRWQRTGATQLNCAVAHINLQQGLAKIEDLLIDTKRITIAGSGVLDLGTEELDLVIAPRPKLPSLVSLANPVEVTGTLAEPTIAVVRIPRRRRLGVTGILAGLVNPAFLLTALADTGTREANPCAAAVERAQAAVAGDSQ